MECEVEQPGEESWDKDDVVGGGEGDLGRPPAGGSNSFSKRGRK